MTGEGERGHSFPPKKRTGECGCAATLGGHEALKGAAQVWGRELAASSSAPSPQLQQGLVQTGARPGLRPKSSRAAGATWPPIHVCACAHKQGRTGASACACLQGSPSPTPTCLCSRRKQDTLSLICTSGASKPQPRQWVVGGGATEAWCAGVCQHACAGPARGCGSLAQCPPPQEGGWGRGSWTSLPGRAQSPAL